ncbi:hypothetical protein EDD21DRAFT_360625 [Dissophora ornata]|nr:hypothetical protein EDD21DRAFT_360625 [Dissophora ornata]
MFIRTNFLIIAALATLCSAASTDTKMSHVDSSPVGVAGVVTCYSGVTWSGTASYYSVSDNTLNTCQDTSSACQSALWSVSYRGTKCIKFYSSGSCSGSETFQVHANIQASDQFQNFKDNGGSVFTARSYKVYNC